MCSRPQLHTARSSKPGLSSEAACPKVHFPTSLILNQGTLWCPSVTFFTPKISEISNMFCSDWGQALQAPSFLLPTTMAPEVSQAPWETGADLVALSCLLSPIYGTCSRTIWVNQLWSMFQNPGCSLEVMNAIKGKGEDMKTWLSDRKKSTWP